MSSFAADVILILHFAFVLFVVGGLAYILVGAAKHWQGVRSLRFRLLHLAAIVIVAGEALLGVVCPLTLWEDTLRGSSSDRSFIARWVHRVMFYSAPEWVFSALYVAFALAVAITFWLIPPRKR